MLVPYLFIVPKDDVKWPEEAWGMKLGIVVRSIRYGNCHVDKREDLESIGFDYSPQEIGTEFPSEKECRRILEEIHFNKYDQRLFFQQQGRDRHKLGECASRGITLIVIPSKYSYGDSLAMRNFIISELIKPRKYPSILC
jgi:hypothetical protein